jgi:hypothetical protein
MHGKTTIKTIKKIKIQNTSTKSICNRAHNYFCKPRITPSSLSHAPHGCSHTGQYLRQAGHNIAGNMISL